MNVLCKTIRGSFMRIRTRQRKRFHYLISYKGDGLKPPSTHKLTVHFWISHTLTQHTRTPVRITHWNTSVSRGNIAMTIFGHNVTLLQGRQERHLEEHPVRVLLVDSFTVFVTGRSHCTLIHHTDKLVKVLLSVARVMLAGDVPVGVTGFAHRKEERSSSELWGAVGDVLVFLQGEFQSVSEKVAWFIGAKELRERNWIDFTTIQERQEDSYLIILC